MLTSQSAYVNPAFEDVLELYRSFSSHPSFIFQYQAFRKHASDISPRYFTMIKDENQKGEAHQLSALASTLKLTRPIVLVGLMGVGKTTVGRRLAKALDVPFLDADSEIEAAAGCSVAEIFDRHGEAAFRQGERKVIKRLLDGTPLVLATGGGAFMNDDTRAYIKSHATSVWLDAELDVLVKRVSRRDTRPLLRGSDPAAILQSLMDERNPTYSEADLKVRSGNGPHSKVVRRIIADLADHCSV